MAKEFKEFENQFTASQLNSMRVLYLNDVITRGVIIDRWEHVADYCVEDQTRVCNAVYRNKGFEQWQCFRVAMKGLSTYDKLKMLHEYWYIHVTAESHGLSKQTSIVRINNYIGALRRGGQLDKDFVVAK